MRNKEGCCFMRLLQPLSYLVVPTTNTYLSDWPVTSKSKLMLESVSARNQYTFYSIYLFQHKMNHDQTSILTYWENTTIKNASGSNVFFTIADRDGTFSPFLVRFSVSCFGICATVPVKVKAVRKTQLL